MGMHLLQPVQHDKISTMTYVRTATLVFLPLSLLSELGIVVLCPSQLVERAVQQYLTEKTSLEAQLMTSLDEETPVISGRDDQLEGEGSGLSEEDINSGDIDGGSPVVGEGNEELEYQQTAAAVVEGEEGEKEEREEGEEKEGTPEQIGSQELPPYFSEVSTYTDVTVCYPVCYCS